MSKPNRLIRETSPYLLQHAHNPVDWHPWGPEALARAKAEDRPILLSVGYSACHWCHVMAHESFENEQTAALMNRLFVCIKVDREERPDIDQIYMQAVQAMTGQGGWPMTVFLTAEGVPFFGGTYFPPEDRQGLAAFSKVLERVAEAYRERRDDVGAAGRELLRVLRESSAIAKAGAELSPHIAESAFQRIREQFDTPHGGLGEAPKFPQPLVWEFLLRHWRRTGDASALDMVRTTLTAMASGGMYDQLGGGFHRYSVDAQWLVPHFEKMLYDNAQLASLYLHAWLATGDGPFRRVAEQTLDYLLREMRHPAGGFFSAQDADSEGVEGKFFVWTPAAVRAALGAGPLAEAALAYWGLADGPNFEGHNILFVPREPAEAARRLGIGTEELERHIRAARQKLFEARERRVHPGRDEKVLASWNGLALSAFAEAGRALNRPDYLDAAERNAGFLTTAMMERGRLRRTWKDGHAKLKGYGEDYAAVGSGLLALYEATLDRRWLDASRSLADDMIRLFWEPDEAAFYDTGTDHEPLVVRPRTIQDNAVPAGASTAAEWILRLAIIFGEDRYADTAVKPLQQMAGIMSQYPSAAGRYLCALDFHLGPVHEIALVWPAAGDRAAAVPLLSAAAIRYQPNRVIVGAAESTGVDLPLLKDRPAVKGRPTAYVCVNHTCRPPVTTPAALANELANPASE